MVNGKYLLAVENLAERNKARLNTKGSPKEKETEELFYWVISRLEWHMQGCWPAKTHHDLIIDIRRGWYNDGSILLKHGNVSEYLSQYVIGKEFDKVMENVVNIFNEIGKNEEKGYHFSAKYLTDTFVVHMVTEK